MQPAVKPHINIYPIARSLASYLLPDRIMKRAGSGGTFSSKYCYSVWLRHLHYLLNKELFKNIGEIKRVAEIGPGDSLGIGLASIYCGVDDYHAFDMIKHTDLKKNEQINRELFDLFKSKKPIPHGESFKNVAPYLASYSFPEYLFHLSPDYYKERFESVQKTLQREDSGRVKIEYVVPWHGSDRIEENSLDLIFSQAVMEHVIDLHTAYQTMYKWLRPGGVISHQIDFKSHEMTQEWNAHWFIGDKMWDFLLRGRKYPINRMPFSAHIKIMEDSGFEIKNIVAAKKKNIFKDRTPELNEVQFTDEDMEISGALIQAFKP
jgi:SAM-dependent methyltransferase